MSNFESAKLYILLEQERVGRFLVLVKLEIEPKKFIKLRCAGTTQVGGHVPLERVGGCHSGECVYPTRTSGQIDLARSVVYPPFGV